MSFYAIVRGPLGVGKSTLAGALADRLGGQVISIDSILESEEWDGGSEGLFLRANRVASARAEALLVREVPVVFDGNFYWQSAIDDLLARLPYPNVIFALRAPLEICLARDRLRPHSYGEEATRAVFEKVARVDRGIPIDATQAVFRILEEMRSHLPPPPRGRDADPRT